MQTTSNRPNLDTWRAHDIAALRLRGVDTATTLRRLRDTAASMAAMAARRSTNEGWASLVEAIDARDSYSADCISSSAHAVAAGRSTDECALDYAASAAVYAMRVGEPLETLELLNQALHMLGVPELSIQPHAGAAASSWGCID